MLALACIGLATAAQADEARVRVPAVVSFASLDVDAGGEPVRIDARLVLPEGAPPNDGFPAVVAMHGCDGPWSWRSGRTPELSARLADWSARLAAHGYVVLVPDSFTGRGRRSVCTDRIGERSIRPATRALDAIAALDFLARRPDVDRTRIALAGWSHGGSAVLATIGGDVRVAGGRPNDAPFFRAAVAFYPGCTAAVRAEPAWRPAVAVDILIGADDDWTPAPACERLADVAHARGDDVRVVVYPGSHHGFDAPSGAVRRLPHVPNGVHRGEGVTVGPNAAARDDARARVLSFLAEKLSR